MKKPLKLILAALLAAVMCLPVFGCGPTETPPPDDGNPVETETPLPDDNPVEKDNMLRDNDFKNDIDRRPDRGAAAEDTTPEEAEGAVLHDNVFEFENSMYKGVSNMRDHRCLSASFEFNTGFGGNVCQKNIYTGASMTFVFESDKTIRSPLIIRASNSYNKNKDFGSVFRVTNNGKSVVDTSMVLPETGETYTGSNPEYFTMVTLQSKISLVKGKNTLVFKAGTNYSCNLDYINIRTSATLTDQSESDWPVNTETVKVTKAPTATTPGEISLHCPETDCKNPTTGTPYPDLVRTLPILTDKSYEVENAANGVKYFLTVGGVRFLIASTETYTLTLQGAKFADGTTSKGISAGTVPELQYEVPDGQRFQCWYNVADEDETFADPFTMPERSVTIAPRFEQIQTHTMTLQGAKFADGTDSKPAKTDDIFDLQELQCNVPEGKVLSGWYNVADKSKVFIENYTMPDADVTLAPAFDVAAYAPRDGSTGGKIELYPKNGYHNDGKSYADGWMRWEDAGAVHDPAHYWGVVASERGAIYAYKGAAEAQLPAGWHFTSLSPYKVEKAKTYTFTYTLENQGASPLSLKIYQTDSGNSRKPTATSAALELDPGQTKTVTITFTGFDNNNVMTTVELVTPVQSFRLGMFINSAIT